MGRHSVPKIITWSSGNSAGRGGRQRRYLRRPAAAGIAGDTAFSLWRGKCPAAGSIWWGTRESRRSVAALSLPPVATHHIKQTWNNKPLPESGILLQAVQNLLHHLHQSTPVGPNSDFALADNARSPIHTLARSLACTPAAVALCAGVDLLHSRGSQSRPVRPRLVHRGGPVNLGAPRQRWGRIRERSLPPRADPRSRPTTREQLNSHTTTH